MAVFNLVVPKSGPANHPTSGPPPSPAPRQPLPEESQHQATSSKAPSNLGENPLRTLKDSGANLIIVKGGGGVTPHGSIDLTPQSADEDVLESAMPQIAPLPISAPEPLLRALRDQALAPRRVTPGKARASKAEASQELSDLERLVQHHASQTTQQLGYTPLTRLATHPSPAQLLRRCAKLTARNLIFALLASATIAAFSASHARVQDELLPADLAAAIAQRILATPDDSARAIGGETLSVVDRDATGISSMVLTRTGTNIDGLAFDFVGLESVSGGATLKAISADQFTISRSAEGQTIAKGSATVLARIGSTELSSQQPVVITIAGPIDQTPLPLHVAVGEHSASPATAPLTVTSEGFRVSTSKNLSLHLSDDVNSP